MTPLKTNKAYFTYVFLASVLVLLMLALFSIYLLDRQKSATDLVTHTFLVKLQTEHVVTLVKDAETAQRGYLLTADTTYLAAYEKATSAVDKSIQQLVLLIADNQKQQERLTELTRLIRYRLSILENAIVLHKTQRHLELGKVLKEGKRVMDVLRTRTVLFEQSEDRLLQQRLIRQKQADKQTSGSILFFTIVAFAVLIVSFLRLRKEIVKRAKAEFTSEQLEIKVAERTKEVADINLRLQAQNARLEKQNEELNSFTFIASHDLKEPLRKIAVFSSRIDKTEAEHFSEKSKEYFGSILKAVRRMQNLIDDVLAYALTNTDGQFRSTDLNEIVQLSTETLSETITAKHAIIHCSNLPVIQGIPQQLEQLFTNVVSNSLKYAKRETPPVISIKAEKANGEAGMDGTCWKIDITDNGIGFEAIHRHKIFQIFQRLHGKTEYSGTGIGLAICKKIAENHGGSISATSVPGEGSTFSVFLPEEQGK